MTTCKLRWKRWTLSVRNPFKLSNWRSWYFRASDTGLVRVILDVGPVLIIKWRVKNGA